MTGTEGRPSGRAVGARAFWTHTRIATVAIIVVGAVGAISVVAAHASRRLSSELITLAAVILVGAGAQAAQRKRLGSGRTIQKILWMVQRSLWSTWRWHGSTSITGRGTPNYLQSETRSASTSRRLRLPAVLRRPDRVAAVHRRAVCSVSSARPNAAYVVHVASVA
jgi:hypothetical protein